MKVLFIIVLLLPNIVFADTITCYLNNSTIKFEGKLISGYDTIFTMKTSNGKLVAVGVNNCVAEISK